MSAPPERALAGTLLGDVGGAEKAPGFDEEDLSRLGQLHVPPVAIEEQRAELVFELLDAPADMRLRDVEVLGGMTEVEMLGERHECRDLLEFHLGRPSSVAFSP